jgi:hypothetical protein
VRALLSRFRGGVVIVYVTTLIALLAIVAVSLQEGSAAALDAVQAQMFLHLARYAADSGVEHGIAIMESELANECAVGQAGSPWCDVLYSPAVGRTLWMDPQGTENTHPNGPKNHLHVLAPRSTSLTTLYTSDWEVQPLVLATGTDVERLASRYVMSALIALQPRFDHANTFLKISNGVDAYFCLRSRGQVRSSPDPNNANSLLLVGNVTVVQKLRIGGPRFCNGKPRIERIGYDVLPGVFDRPPAGAWSSFPGGITPH